MTKKEFDNIVLDGICLLFSEGLIDSRKFVAARMIAKGILPVSPEESASINEAVEIADEIGARR